MAATCSAACRQHTRFLPQHIAPPVSFDTLGASGPTGPDPRPPADRRRAIVFGCDIDHTLINQAHAVLPKVPNGWYPEGFPPWGQQGAAPPTAIGKSDLLMHYVMTNRKLLHITNFSDNHKTWPDSARVREAVPVRVALLRCLNADSALCICVHIVWSCRELDGGG